MKAGSWGAGVLAVAAALVIAAPESGRGQQPGPTPTPSPSPSSSPVPNELDVELDLATHAEPLFTPDGLPKWQVKQNNQVHPSTFRCIVQLFPVGTRGKVVLELVPAVTPAPAASPAAQYGPSRIIQNRQWLDVPVKRSQLASDGVFLIRVRLAAPNGPVGETKPFFLELR